MTPCEECRVGRYRNRRMPYTAWLGSQMVVVPNVPALVCDGCGDVLYDFDFVRQLQVMIEDHVYRRRSSSPARRGVLAPISQPRQRLRRSR
jgi:YgiT-type zinc finger domain-containing protein